MEQDFEIYEKINDVHERFENADIAERIDHAHSLIAPPTVRSYPEDCVRIALPYANEFKNEDFSSLSAFIEQRHSVRAYKPEGFERDRLGALLASSVGLRQHRYNAYNTHQYPVLLSPTAGGLQSLNVYVIVRNIAGLESGLYYYDPLKNVLVSVWTGSVNVLLSEVFVSADFCQTAPACIMLTSQAQRYVWKYGYRGYRLANVDCGIAAAQISLAAVSLGLGTCMVAAYSSEKASELMSLEDRELPLLGMAIGVPDEQ